jgi:uncharacterized protein (DUF427 family)
MSTKVAKTPDRSHPISIEPHNGHIVITHRGRVIADTRDALTLRESVYPAVHYIPRNDVDMTVLERTEYATYCPYKGDASYYSISVDGERADNAIWTYEAPHDAVAAIKDHVAFYTERVDTFEERPE